MNHGLHCFKVYLTVFTITSQVSSMNINENPLSALQGKDKTLQLKVFSH